MKYPLGKQLLLSKYTIGNHDSGGSHGQAKGQYSLYTLIKYCTLPVPLFQRSAGSTLNHRYDPASNLREIEDLSR